VLAFVGATGSTTISFILPGLFYWKVRVCGGVIGMETEIAQLSSNDASKRRLNRLALGLMIYGIGIMVFCLSFNIYKIMHHTEPAH